MKVLPFLTGFAAFGPVGCASNADAGDALVAAGTATAVVAAAAATERRTCTVEGCVKSTSKHGAAAAAGVAAGVALAAAGAALRNDEDESPHPAPSTSNASRETSWRLVRKPDESPADTDSEAP